MKAIDFTALAIKMAGFVLLVLVLSKIPEYIQSFLSLEKSGYATGTLYYILPLVIVSFACVMLLLFPYKISSKLIVTPEAKEPGQLAETHQIIGIRLLGLLLLFWSVSDMVYNLFNYLMLRNLADASFPISTYNYPYIISTGIEILFAFILLRNTKSISAYLNEISK